MLKLYKKENETISYAECWIDEDENIATIHTGIIGTTGCTKEIPCDDEAAFLADFRSKYTRQGYSEWPEEEQIWLVLQWPMTTLEGNKYNRGIRDKATELLDELLGWNGLGHVDGFDMGRTANPKEEFALNIFCLVVDKENSLKCILDTLPKQLDCSRLKIATRAENDDDYTLEYCTKSTEHWFYI